VALRPVTVEAVEDSARHPRRRSDAAPHRGGTEADRTREAAIWTRTARARSRGRDRHARARDLIRRDRAVGARCLGGGGGEIVRHHHHHRRGGRGGDGVRVIVAIVVTVTRVAAGVGVEVGMVEADDKL